MTTITKDQIHLIDGEICVTKTPEYCHRNIEGINTVGGMTFLTVNGVCSIVTHSTAELEGVAKLDRSLFVKSNSELIELGIVLANNYAQIEDYGTSEHDYLEGFKAAIDVTKKLFTLNQLRTAMDLSFEAGRGIKIIDANKILEHIIPLSIPESIKIHNNEVKVNWE